MSRFIYNFIFASINLFDAMIAFLTLGYKNTGLPLKFAAWWALRSIKNKRKRSERFLAESDNEQNRSKE